MLQNWENVHSGEKPSLLFGAIALFRFLLNLVFKLRKPDGTFLYFCEYKVYVGHDFLFDFPDLFDVHGDELEVGERAVDSAKA
jgi:hypothetical protein